MSTNLISCHYGKGRVSVYEHTVFLDPDFDSTRPFTPAGGLVSYGTNLPVLSSGRQLCGPHINHESGGVASIETRRGYHRRNDEEGGTKSRNNFRQCVTPKTV